MFETTKGARQGNYVTVDNCYDNCHEYLGKQCLAICLPQGRILRFDWLISMQDFSLYTTLAIEYFPCVQNVIPRVRGLAINTLLTGVIAKILRQLILTISVGLIIIE